MRACAKSPNEKCCERQKTKRKYSVRQSKFYNACKVKNVMDSWLARGLVENRSDSSGYDTSDCGAAGSLIFLSLLYANSCSKRVLLSLAAYIVSVLYLIAFSDRGIVFKQP